MLNFGTSMFFTDYSMAPGELGQALEERGFESVWAPEHSHIPLSRKTPFPSGGDVPKRYYDAMDPFVTLTAAAMAARPAFRPSTRHAPAHSPARQHAPEPAPSSRAYSRSKTQS